MEEKINIGYVAMTIATLKSFPVRGFTLTFLQASFLENYLSYKIFQGGHTRVLNIGILHFNQKRLFQS